MSFTVIGCTATRRGLTADQARWARAFAGNVAQYVKLFVHGSCVGGDEQLNDIFRKAGVRTRARPADVRAELVSEMPSDEVMPSLAPLARNDLIVEDAQFMICFPGTSQEEIRSGTWATIRRAKASGKPGRIVWPDGRAEDLRDWVPRTARKEG